MERRLAAILAADVKGYSQLTEIDEESSTATLCTYRTAVERLISSHRGHIFSSAGDGVVAEFPSIVEAIRCAVAIQKEIAERNASLPEAQRMQFRIGVNLGDVIAENGNFYGTGVNVAVRLEQLAEAGGICVSRIVFDQIRKVVELPFEDIGEQRVKNIAEPIHVYRIHPAPLPWGKRLFSRVRVRRRLGVAAGLLLLLVAVAAVAAYFRNAELPWGGTLTDMVGPSLPVQASIAVLPFADLSSGSDQYLADGITEELITGLAKFPEFVVMARNSTFAYKNKPTDVRDVGKTLNVRYVVEGSIQRDDRNVRVTAQLVDANTGRHLWAERYDRELKNIFAIRDDITRAVAGTLGGLQGKVAQAEAIRLSGKDPNSFTAYSYVMKGWEEWRKFTKENNAAARQLFEIASSVDPNYARAYAGLAWTYANDYDYEWTDDFDRAIKRATELARKAVSLDPSDYQAHWVLGWSYLYNWEHEKALASYSRARDLNPNDAELLAEMANLLIYIGQPKQAITQVKEAIRLNPFHEKWYDEYLGWAYEEAGMPREAIEVLEQVISKEPDPEEIWILPTLAAAYASPGIARMDDAQAMVKTILTLKPEFSCAEVASRNPYKTQKLTDRYVNALRRAGLPQ
jgi:TolB-like protein/class 3 adenylate cyclase/Tfp pilus assembly protein PilF